jgi:glycosyltransferase involved in cell wall biosynthesis
MLDRIRRWDVKAASRVDHYIANSELTRQRIADYYGREASIVHPPVDVGRFTPGDAEDFFLIVTQVVRHKHVELALEAARRAGKQVKVVGFGPDLERLKTLYDGTVEFMGHLSDPELTALYARAKALIVPNIEEFGIAMVEAQAAGRPVLAADGGGAREIVVRGQTGELAPVGDVDALAEALREVDFDSFDTGRITANAARFSERSFCDKLSSEVHRLTGTAAPLRRP